MPAKSKAQFRAMQAAAHGKSTLGIPADVGKEFVGATASYRKLPAKSTKPKVKARFRARFGKGTRADQLEDRKAGRG